MSEKSENFNSLKPILFELCKKKLQGGQIDPPPSRNRVKGSVREILKLSICRQVRFLEYRADFWAIRANFYKKKQTIYKTKQESVKMICKVELIDFQTLISTSEIFYDSFKFDINSK